MVIAPVPYDPLPRLVHAGRSVHGDIPRQEWRVEGLWGMHLYRYAGDLTVAGHKFRLAHGVAGFTPPGALASYRFEGLSTHVFGHLEIPSNAVCRSLPLVFPVGASFGTLWAQLEEVIGLISSDHRRAEIKAWDVWYSLQDAAMAPETALPDVVKKTLDLVEARLHEPLTVRDLATEAAISHNQLTRLFRAATGKTVIETIRLRRMERARHLLERSTMPIKEIASLVGIEDLQLFNKTVRRSFGLSPTDMRARERTS